MKTIREYLEIYAVHYGSRLKRNEKENFLKYVEKECKENNLNVTRQTNVSSLLSITNLIIGDINKADIVIATAYDTPSKVFQKQYTYFPFSPSRNKKSEKTSLLIETLMILFWAFIIALSTYFLSNQNLITKIISILLIVFSIYRIFKLTSSKSPSSNFSMNNASVALLMKLALENKTNTAYVLLDQSVMSYEGIKKFKETISKDKKVLFLMNLASGDKTICMYQNDSSISNYFAQKIPNVIEKKVKDNANKGFLEFFPNGSILVTGDNVEEQLAFKNARTEKDIQIDIPRLQTIEQTIKELINDKDIISK